MACDLPTDSGNVDLRFTCRMYSRAVLSCVQTWYTELNELKSLSKASQVAWVSTRQYHGGLVCVGGGGRMCVWGGGVECVCGGGGRMCVWGGEVECICRRETLQA